MSRESRLFDQNRYVNGRALSSTVGFILIFSFLIITFSIYQGIVIPNQNHDTEFKHNLKIQSDIQSLRTAVLQAGTGTDSSVTLPLGPDYPQRLIARNIGIASGSLYTEKTHAGIKIENATALEQETTNYINGSQLGPYKTESVVYEPNYAHYTDAPTTVYENSIVYNRFGDNQSVTTTEQAIIDGREITLIALTGTLTQAQRGTVSVDTKAVSASSRQIAVTNASGGPVNLTIPSRLTVANWTSLLAEEMNDSQTDNGYVERVTNTGQNQISIILTAKTTYELRLARVAVGTGTPPVEPHYATDVTGDDTSLAEGGTKKLIVEVRDRFNNPVSNVTLESSLITSAGSGDTITPQSVTTDTDGRANFTYTAPGDVDGTQPADIQIYFSSPTPARQSVVFNITVLDADGSGACGRGGEGATAQWCSNVNTTISQPGGRITEIGSVSSLQMVDPSFSPLRPEDNQVRPKTERFRLAFVIEKDIADPTSTTRYLFAVPNTTAGFSQSTDDASTTINNRNVVIYRDESVNTDGHGYVTLVDENMKQGHLKEWYTGDQVIDLLDDSHYSGNVTSELTEIQTFMQNNNVRIYIVDMDGRVTLNIE